MLWNSEIKPRSWWTKSLNLVKISVELLHTLSVCLTDTCCPHYFINNCNLVDSSLSLGTIASELVSIDEACLSTWFVEEYIGKCAQLCPAYVQQLFNDADAVAKLNNAVSAIVEFRVNTSLRDLHNAVTLVEYYLPCCLSSVEQNVRSCVCWMNEMTTRNAHLSEYFSAIMLLHVAHKIIRNGLNENLMDILATLLGQFVDTPRYSKRRCSVLSLKKAAKLMKVVVNKSVSTVQLIEIELSKAYLHRALRCKDSDNDSIYCLANVYLAVLYYTTGQYQTAIDHCTLVTRSQDHSQCSSHVVHGELLSKIDDNIDNILGLTVFYQYVLSAALNHQQQGQYVGVFTTETFAYYLYCRLLSVTQCRQVTQVSLHDISQQFAQCISEIHQLFIGDVLVFKLLNHAFKGKVHDKSEWSRCGRSSVTESALNITELVELLQQSAVDHLTTFRQLEARDFGSVATIVTTDFEALYAYKHGDYQRCLQLSTQNVRTLLYAGCMTGVATYPEFIQLLDDDIVSLTALTLIVNPKCWDTWVNVAIIHLTLSLYLMTQSQLKLGHSVTSLTETIDYIKVARRITPGDRALDHLTLKLSKCKITAHLRMIGY